MEEVITSNKKKYHSNLGSKLNNPRTHCKTYWSLLETLVSGRRVSHITLIQIGNKFITNFTEKAKTFSNYYAKQCRVIHSKNQYHDSATSCTNKRLNYINFAKVHILKILKNLDTCKAQWHDNLSIRIIT